MQAKLSVATTTVGHKQGDRRRCKTVLCLRRSKNSKRVEGALLGVERDEKAATRRDSDERN